MSDFSPQQLRAAFGSFATGVTVITTRGPAGELIGMTVNSLASLSLDPPLLVWCIDLGTPSFETFRDCSHYAINVLGAHQMDISNRFANRSEDKFAGLRWREGAGGAPLIAGCIAYFECANEAQHPGGDHRIMVGRILSHHFELGSPLLFFGSRYATLNP